MIMAGDSTVPTTDGLHGHANASVESLLSNASLECTLEQYMLTVPKAKLLMTDDAYLNELGPFRPETMKHELLEMRALAFRQHELIKRLRMELDIESGRVKILRSENEHLKKVAVATMAEQEQEEEQITNKLLRKIIDLKKEKSEIMSRMEQEEEYIANTLQRKLAQLQKEKVDLEIAMENEQEAMTNRLVKQLDNSRKLRSSSGSFSSIPPLTPRVEPDNEMFALKNQLVKVEQDYTKKINEYQNQIVALNLELEAFKQHRVPTPTSSTDHIEI